MSIKSVEIPPAIPGADLLGRLLAFDPTRRLSVVGSPAEFWHQFLHWKTDEYQ